MQGYCKIFQDPRQVGGGARGHPLPLEFVETISEWEVPAAGKNCPYDALPFMSENCSLANSEFIFYSFIIVYNFQHQKKCLFIVFFHLKINKFP